MLDIFRKNSKSVASILVVAMSVLLMASFGLDYYQGGGRREAALTINGEKVSFEQFRRAQENLLRMTRNPDLAKQYAIDSLINDTLFSGFIDQLGVVASTAQIEKKIQENPYFSSGFTLERYRTFLQTIGMTAGQLERVMGNEIARDQIRDSLRDFSWFSDAELQALYNQNKATYKFRYAQISPNDFLKRVEVDDGKLKAFFEENQEPYRKERQVRFSYVSFRPVDFEKKVEVSEDDLLELYGDDSNSEIRDPKQVRIKKVIFDKVKDPQSTLPFAPEEKKAEDATQTKVDSNDAQKSSASEVAKQLKAGESFDKVAQEIAARPGGNARIEDLGMIQPDTLEPKLREAADQLDLGDASSVIELPDNFVVLYAADFKPEQKRAFDEVRGLLEAKLRKERSPDYARLAAEDFLAHRTEGGNRQKTFADFAKERGYEAKSTGGFVGEKSNLPNAPGLPELVIRLGEGDQDIVEVEDTAYIVQIDEVKDSHIPPFEEVRGTVEERYRKQRARELAEESGREFLKEAKGENGAKKRSFADVAAARNLSVKETAEVTHDSAAGEIFNSRDLRNVVFSLTPERPLADKVFQTGDTFSVVELEERKLPNPVDFSKERKNLISEERERGGQRLFAILRARLRDSAEIVQNPSLGS